MKPPLCWKRCNKPLKCKISLVIFVNFVSPCVVCFSYMLLFCRSHIASGLQEKEMTQKHLSSAEERIKFLEEKLRDAEIDADGKSEEVLPIICTLCFSTFLCFNLNFLSIFVSCSLFYISLLIYI